MPVETLPSPGMLPVFSEALFNAQATIPAGVIGPDGKPAPKRFNVYRNNVIVSLMDAVEQTFPAVQAMLGEEYFRALAQAFVVAHPPQSPVLLWYGEAFAGFLESFEPLRAYPYLADVARIEWAWLEAYHAADAMPLDPALLSTVSSDELAGLTFKLHPAVRTIASPWPVFSLAANNRFATADAFEVELSEAQSVLITRPYLDVELRLLRPGALRFLESLELGATLSSAAESAMAGHEDFDLGATLGDFLDTGVFTAASLAS